MQIEMLFCSDEGGGLLNRRRCCKQAPAPAALKGYGEGASFAFCCLTLRRTDSNRGLGHLEEQRRLSIGLEQLGEQRRLTIV